MYNDESEIINILKMFSGVFYAGSGIVNIPLGNFSKISREIIPFESKNKQAMDIQKEMLGKDPKRFIKRPFQNRSGQKCKNYR